MYVIFLQSNHCIKKTLTVSCKLLCESGDRVKVDQSSFSAYLHAVMLRHHCSEYGMSLTLDQGQGHSVTVKFFSIYHNPKVKSYIYLSYGTS